MNNDRYLAYYHSPMVGDFYGRADNIKDAIANCANAILRDAMGYLVPLNSGQSIDFTVGIWDTAEHTFVMSGGEVWRTDTPISTADDPVKIPRSCLMRFTIPHNLDADGRRLRVDGPEYKAIFKRWLNDFTAEV